MSLTTAARFADHRRPSRVGTTTTDRAELIHDAQTILDGHTCDAVGMCAGCRVMWNRLTPHPCTQASWARAVVGRLPTAETLTALGLRTA